MQVPVFDNHSAKKYVYDDQGTSFQVNKQGLASKFALKLSVAS